MAADGPAMPFSAAVNFPDGSTANGCCTAEYGIDKSSVEHNGNLRKVWVMLDYRKPQQTSLGKTFWSSRALMEMQCSSKEVRTRSLALYSGPKLSGEMLTSEGVFNQWQVAPPNSPVFNIMQSLCEKH